MLLFVLGLGLMVVYFIPSVVGFVRCKQNGYAIFLCNLFLGWSVVGWLAALVWSVRPEPLPAAGVPERPGPSRR